MLNCYITEKATPSIPLSFVATTAFAQWLATQPEHLKIWVTATGFTAKPDTICLIPNDKHEVAQVLVGCTQLTDFWIAGALATSLPVGNYHLAQDLEPFSLRNIILGWGLGAYQFTRYKKSTKTIARLVISEPNFAQPFMQQVNSIYLVRDLINTPTENMGPLELARTAATIATAYGAHFSQIVGDELLQQNYPAIHTVGRASAQAPRLLEIRWGNPAHPKVTVVGKGVCFDTGGLDLKPADNMLLMKKDMGGAAHALGLAQLVMAANLPVQLRVLIPAVENSIAANAYRPGDVIATRKGLSVEIGNTDAEGRVILADALTEAAAEKPELIIDFATLTGAARVALGTDVPAMFTDDEQLASQLAQTAAQMQDPLWRLPLYQPYRQLLDSLIADINNATASGYAGAITAALFLKEFVPADVSWVHFDLMAWNIGARPGRPAGGEAMSLRAVFNYLAQRFNG